MKNGKCPEQQSLCVRARFSALPELLALFSRFSSLPDGAASRTPLLRAALAVEELFANSIHHGYGGESDNPVWLSVGIDRSSVRVTYMDAAGEFDPFAYLDDFSAHSERELDQRRIGGLGRMLIKQMSRHCTYRREDGRNVITLEYDLEPDGRSQAG